MGVDIGIAVYDEAREKRYKLVEAILAVLKYSDEDVLEDCSFDLEEYTKEERKLRHARWNAKPPKNLERANQFAGSRWSNLGIYIDQYMQFTPDQKVIVPGPQMEAYINVLIRFAKATDFDDHVVRISQLFTEAKAHNLMIYPA